MNKTKDEPETAKRLEIIADIAQYLQSHAGPIVSSRVGGSMSFAQNHAIRADSDIDLDIFVPFDQLELVNPFLEFIDGNMLFEDSNTWQGFDLIAIDGSRAGIEINLWLLNTKTFDEIAQLQRDRVVFYSVKQPSDIKHYKTFGGGTCTLDRNVVASGKGYKSDRPIMYNGQLLSENYILNNMFFVFPIFGAEYSNASVDKMWQAFLEKYPAVTHEQIYSFIIDKVSERFSPNFRAKLDAEITHRLAPARIS